MGEASSVAFFLYLLAYFLHDNGQKMTEASSRK